MQVKMKPMLNCLDSMKVCNSVQVVWVINMVKKIICVIGAVFIAGVVWVIKRYRDWSELEELDDEL